MMQSKRDLRELIPVHRLEESTDQGFELERIFAFGKEEADKLVIGLHRDDHYVFVLQETGKSKMTNDFEVYSLEDNMVLCVFPGAVHGYYSIEEKSSGWFIALDPGLVPDVFRSVLDDPLLSRRSLTPGVEGMAELAGCLEMIHGLK